MLVVLADLHIREEWTLDCGGSLRTLSALLIFSDVMSELSLAVFVLGTINDT